MAKRSKKKTPGLVSSKVAEVTAAQSKPSGLNREWVWGLVLLVAVAAVYLPVWWAGYIWDDDAVITTNPVIVGPLGLTEIWTTKAADICPLTLTTFWLEHALWGLEALPYHLVSVLLHVASAVALWRVLLILRVPGAWLGAALWALHPVQVESVAWITEMKNTESALFFLLAIYFFVRGLRVGAKDKWNYPLTLLFSAMAMASKSSTVILPIILCFCAWWIEGRWYWRNLTKIIPIFLMSIITGLVSMWTQNLQLVSYTNPQWTRTWPERLITAADAVWFYLGKLMWPHPLMPIYPRWQIDAGNWISYLPLVVVIVVGLLLWLKRKAWSRPYLFAWTCFLVALLPALGLINNTFSRYSFVSDHFQYLASMAPLALAGAGLARVTDFVLTGKTWLLSTLGAGVLLALGMQSWQRAWTYENLDAFWANALARNPNCWLAYNNLGEILVQKGQYDEAIADYQKGLAINPHLDELHYNVGVALNLKGQVDKAMDEFQKALAIEPAFALAHLNLGDAQLNKGWVDEAIIQFNEVLRDNPNDARAFNNLGVALTRQGQLQEAIIHFKRALELDPGYKEARYNLARTQAMMGQQRDPQK